MPLQVLVQRIAGPSSHFATYISYLPVGVSGVPMFFPREALEAIEYPPVVEQVSVLLCCFFMFLSCSCHVLVMSLSCSCHFLVMFFPREALEAIEYPPVVEEVSVLRW
jgi:cytochrome b subunit of formate dehydrogenase